MKRHDILESVISDLTECKGELTQVARAVDMSYDTVLRIMNRENDPGYSKVLKLYEHFARTRRRAETLRKVR